MSLHSSRNIFNKYGAQLSIVPSAHCAAATTKSTGTYSLRHFLSSLNTMIFVDMLVVASLMRLIMIPHDPLSVPYVFFISSVNSFSFVLSLRNCMGISPHGGSPVIYVMSSTSIDMGSSTHRYPPWVTAIRCLTQLVMS
jgi:hypothetical protein